MMSYLRLVEVVIVHVSRVCSMSALFPPQAGRILVDGVPLPELNLRSLHRQMAIVAQDTQLFATTYGFFS